MKETVSKILKPDGKALIVAMDHARDWGALPGLVDPAKTIEMVIDAGADGIMTTYGVIKQFGHLMFGRVSVLLRADGYNSYLGEKWMEYTKWQRLYSVEDALRVGADAVVLNYFLGIPAEGDSLRVMAETAAEADKLGMPLVVEALACKSPNIPDHLDAKYIAVAARIAAEHGADVVKCYYSGTPEYRQVIQDTYVPVTIAGGPAKETMLDALKMVSDAMRIGVKGVFFGQNIWRSANPTGMVRALSDIIHRGVDPEMAHEVHMGGK
jgi:DhnA family fructose-bisphosphate aldolase class Ia